LSAANDGATPRAHASPAFCTPCEYRCGPSADAFAWYFAPLPCTPLANRFLVTAFCTPCSQAVSELQKSLLAAGRFDHPLSCVAFLELGRIALEQAKNDAAITEATYMARRADIQLRMADDFGGKTSAGVRTHFVTFGDIAIVGCNIEPFCEIGMEVKKRSPFAITFMCGYTNGRMAYMPTPEEWTKGGYEVENSPFGQNAARALTDQILQELALLRR